MSIAAGPSQTSQESTTDALIALTRLNNDLIQALHREQQARLEQESQSDDLRRSLSFRLAMGLRSWLCPDNSRRRQAYRLLRKAGHLCRRYGLVTVVQKVGRKVRRWLSGKVVRLPDALPNRPLGKDEHEQEYQRWIVAQEPGPAELEEQRQARFQFEPTISVIVPTFNTPLAFLLAAMESVCTQTYGRWQLCIADGASTDPALRSVLSSYQFRDERIKVRFLSENLGIAGNTNAALKLATGEYVTFLDHDDTLAPFALHEAAKALNDHPDADLLYSDEDKIDTCGRRRYEPFFKPAWAPDTLRSYNYLCHLSVYRHALVRQLGGIRQGFDGSQDYDLVLRATERSRQIVHIPKVLYHWRDHAASTARDFGCKPAVHEHARKALADHLTRIGLEGEVDREPRGLIYQVRYRFPSRPLVSIIIPNKDQHATLRTCLESIAKSTYDNYEVMVVENNSTEPATFAYYEGLKSRPNHRVIVWPREFNFSAINNWAATQARGEVLLLLNNDTEAINPDWLQRMLDHAMREDVGAVGAKLYYPDGTIQHGGVIIGLGGVAAHAHQNIAGDEVGSRYRLIATQNLSAVTAACVMMRRDVFDSVGGFDEKFAVAFNDVDLCLKIRQAGKLVVWTPHAELWHYESKSRGPEDTAAKQIRFAAEIALFHKKWADVLRDGDPYYNPNLTLSSTHLTPEPNCRAPRARSLKSTSHAVRKRPAA